MPVGTLVMQVSGDLKKSISHSPNTRVSLLSLLSFFSLPLSLTQLLFLNTPIPATSAYHLFLVGIPTAVSCRQIGRTLLGIPGKMIILSSTANGDGERANCITITVTIVMLSSPIPRGPNKEGPQSSSSLSKQAGIRW